MAFPPVPLSSDFFFHSSLPVCNHMFNFTGHSPRGIPGVWWTGLYPLRFQTQRTAVINQLCYDRACVCSCACKCVCWKWFCFPSHACSSANKPYLFTGKWYWKWEWCKGIACFVDLPLSVSYFLLLRYDLWHVTFSLGPWLLVGGTEDQKVAGCVALRLQPLTFYLPACVATSCWNSFSIC